MEPSCLPIPTAQQEGPDWRLAAASEAWDWVPRPAAAWRLAWGAEAWALARQEVRRLLVAELACPAPAGAAPRLAPRLAARLASLA